MTTTPAKRELSPTQRQAAFLEGQGLQQKDIAEVVGCAPKTLTVWGRDELYVAERAKYTELELQRVEPLLVRLKTEVLDALLHSTKRMRELLDTEDADGRPLVSARVAAARELTGIGRLFSHAEASGSDSPSASATVTVVFKDKDGTEILEVTEEKGED